MRFASDARPRVHRDHPADPARWSRTTRDGRPVAVTFLGPALSEARLLRIAHQFQEVQ